MKLIKWTPQQSMFGDFDRMLNEVFGDGWNLPLMGSGRSNWVPAIDIAESDLNFRISADLPGLSKKDVKIELHDGVLTVRGERAVENDSDDGNFHRRERSFGAFERSFHLPEEVLENKITAGFKNGQLNITLPKSKVVQSKGREIKIS
ncbi:MAG: Hsp20/alpha crystallin family protein [Candidatus Marinimicrobia bacterium]|jgi:HSP20 family protein|nr:Hsp20/alpha crystallin family protein [Candidatus Neomarinimicrobiota bacterium]MDP6789934.1 Hsp20/alpha crystallin family protein [Candidatus Neomarinimicrobiota bacterium]MDP7071693.1 Hsp20/alpha crystallin family protein [Candidatus Neomarinimicrobiota bacterium]